MSTASKASKIAFWGYRDHCCSLEHDGLHQFGAIIQPGWRFNLAARISKLHRNTSNLRVHSIWDNCHCRANRCHLFDDATWSGHRIVLGRWPGRIRRNDPNTKRRHPIPGLGQRNVDRIGRNLCAIRVARTRLSNLLQSTYDFGTMKQQWRLSQRVMV